jgi:hypothetical protein
MIGFSLWVEEAWDKGKAFCFSSWAFYLLFIIKPRPQLHSTPSGLNFSIIQANANYGINESPL